MSPSAEQKNEGVRVSCERGEIAFFFSFYTPSPPDATPHPLPLAPYYTHSLRRIAHALVPLRPHSAGCRGEERRGSASVFELPLLIRKERCSAARSGRPPVASQQDSSMAM